MAEPIRTPRRAQDAPASLRALPSIDYAAADPHARQAWFLAALPTLQGWALCAAARRAEPGENPRDLVQEGFAGALQRWQAFTPDPALPLFSAFKRWFWGVLRNVVRETHRNRRLRAEVPFPGEAREDDAPNVALRATAAASSPGHEGQAEARSMLRALEAATTPVRWRAIVAIALEDTAREIAVREGASLRTAEWWIREARNDVATVEGAAIKRRKGR